MRLTLYIADRKKNQLMSAFDLCPSYKVFVSPVDAEIEREGTNSEESFILQLIEFSKTRKDYWVPAIDHNGFLYAADGIKEISDGNHIMFVKPKAAVTA